MIRIPAAPDLPDRDPELCGSTVRTVRGAVNGCPFFFALVGLILAALTATPRLAAEAPAVETGPATYVTETTATLTANVTGPATGAGFEYGATTAYGSSVGVVYSEEMEGSFTVALTIEGLTPNTLYHYRAAAAKGIETSTGEDRTFIAGNNSPIARDDDLTLPPGFGPFHLKVLANDTDGDKDPLQVISVTQPAHGSAAIANGGFELTYQLTDENFVGTDTFRYVVSDGLTTDSATVNVHLPIREPVFSILFKKGDNVPGAGVSGSGVPAGATFQRFGLPSINDVGDVAFRASIESPAGSSSVIVGPKGEEGSAVLVSSGENAPSADGSPTGLTFTNFKHPLFNRSGEVAFIATVTGDAGASSNDLGIWTNQGGTLRMAAREGDVAPGISGDAAVFAHFISVAFGDPGVDDDSSAPSPIAFVAELETGRGGVTTANDLGLWFYQNEQSGSPLGLLLREGTVLDLRPEDAFPGKTVLSFTALQPLLGAYGQGHGVGFNRFTGGANGVQALVKFTDGTQAIVAFLIGREPPVVTIAETSQLTSSDRRFRSFGLPTQSGTGQSAFIAKFQIDAATGVHSGNNSAIYVANDLDTTAPFLMVSEGDPAPDVDNAVFRLFQNVVNDGVGNYAFLGTIGGANITSVNDTGVWRDSSSNGLRLLTREGSSLPGPENGTFLKFLSMAMSDDGRVIFKARVRNDTTLERRTAIWFTDASDSLRPLVKEGDVIPGTAAGPVEALGFLERVDASPAQTRSFNGGGAVIFRATFADGSQAVVKATLP